MMADKQPILSVRDVSKDYEIHSSNGPVSAPTSGPLFAGKATGLSRRQACIV